MQYELSKIAERIKQERENKNLSQDALAEILHVNRNTVGRWELQKVYPPLGELCKMCELFECELGYLLCEYDCKTREYTDIQKITGLSETAIEALAGTKDRRTAAHRTNLETREKKPNIDFISLFIESEQYWRNLEAGINNIADFKKPDMNVPGNESHSIIEYVVPGLYGQLQADFTRFIETIVNYLREGGEVSNGTNESNL